MRRAAAIVLAVLLVAPALTAPPATKPRLAVILMVDGLSWERLNAWRPWFTSGLKRLLREGAVASRCHYPHLNTLTSPGHASVATGVPPSLHGVPTNQWYVPSASGAGMETVYAATQPPPGLPEQASPTRGPGRLRVATLGDRLVERDASARVVSLSSKDKSAIFLAGRDPRHAVYWYEEAVGTYVTSTVADLKSPNGAAAAAVVARFNQEKAGTRLGDRFGTVWSRMPVPDPVPAPGFTTGFEARQNQILGPGFPHDLSKARVPLRTALLSTPFTDRLLTDLALELLADEALALGRDDVPDLLALSYSAHDFVAHDYGPESVEALEILRALDVELGRLLDELERRFGTGSVLVALCSDHGFLPLVEAAKQVVTEQQILTQLNAAVDAKLGRTGGTRLVHAIGGCSLWLNRAALAVPGAPDPARVTGIVRRELSKNWKAAVARTIVPGDREVRDSYVPGRSGDLFVIPRHGIWLGSDGLGTSHGSSWEYDTHVPLIFWGGEVRSRVISSPTTPYDVAPTLAAWLGVSLPAATGKTIR